MPGQGRRGPGGGVGAAPPPFFPSRRSRGLVLVAAAALAVSEAGKGVEGGGGVGVGVEAATALGTDAAPVAREEGASEQVGPDFEAVVAPFVALGTDADQGGLIGEERQLDRLGHRALRRVGQDSPGSVSLWRALYEGKAWFGAGLGGFVLIHYWP